MTRKKPKVPADLAALGFEWYGQIAVDTARVILVDPAYVLARREDEPGEVHGMLRPLPVEDVYEADEKGDGLIANGLGLVVPSGLGDGLYDVYVRWQAVSPEWGAGPRVGDLLVRFIDPV